MPFPLVPSKPWRGRAAAGLGLLLSLSGCAQWLATPASTDRLATAHDGPLLLHCARLIDVEQQMVMTPASILVEGDTITAIGPDLQVPEGARQVDLRDQSCAPGFIDLHVHLANDIPELAHQRSSAERALRAWRAARSLLDTGFTSIRSLGMDRDFESLALRDAIAAGELIGPRIFAASHGLTGPGSGEARLSPQASEELADLHGNYVLIVSTPEEAREAVRRELDSGADWIKLLDSRGTGLSPEIIAAAVDETHRRGKRVVSHINPDPQHKAARLAIEAGVDSIDHAFVTDPALLKRMATQGIAYVPTMFVIDLGSRLPPGTTITENNTIPEGMNERLVPIVAMMKANTRAAFEAGVPIALGSDVALLPANMGWAIREFTLLAEATGSTWAALRAGTITAAQVLGAAEHIGSLKVGKQADIVAMPGNPVTDIAAVEKVSFVMHDGRIVRGH